ncbi:MAG: nitroreductase family protein [Bacillota bacterium]|jgi:nitroreductase|nr:nitroreductase family protein [Bacillota bacterium]NLM31189.1 NAD(P)H nitroreductase [Acholeplasmataceae bacterium]HOA79312.1 nitroreductase family protein [Bacilli bacterium]HPZ27995.1 nitroreductase family protein [Bacilli bacterium]HQC89859.1 nitroreductase family protein [Bacilli bacterium]
MNNNKFMELVLKRFSCRRFSRRPIEKEKIASVIDAARFSPSACNGQPWKVHVVLPGEKRERVATALQQFGMNKFASDAPVFLVITEEKGSLLPAAADLIKKVDYTALDIGIFTAHLALAATSAGLSSCIIGWFNARSIQKVLKTKRKIRLVIALGYGEAEAGRKKRKHINEIMEFHE